MSTEYDRQLSAWINLARAQGWTVTTVSHPQFKAPDGVSIVHASSTTSGGRALENLRSQLRRAGLHGL